jgi:hypothetical protein
VVVTIKSDSGEVVGEMLANEKQFKTGSRGFYANAKLDIAGKRYQAQVQLVEVGSKAAAASQ